jgi:hypothetical protein
MEFSLVARFDTAAARSPGRSGPALVVFDWKNVWSLTILPCLRVLTVFPTVGAGGWGHSRGRFRVDSAEPGSAGAVPRQRSADRQPGRSLWLFYTSGRGSHDPCQLVWQVKKFAGARGRRHALLRALACQTCAPARQAGRGRSWVPSLEMCRTTRRFPGSNQCRLGRHFAG